MFPFDHRTKIVATIGPASNSPEIMRQLIKAGMVVARLNFSHGSYEDHAQTIAYLRQVSDELKVPVTLLQDLQGPKIRVGKLPEGTINLQPGSTVNLIPLELYKGKSDTVPIDYPYLAEEAEVGAKVLLDDGLMELHVKAVIEQSVVCQVVRGGILKSRKGVNLPSLNLRLPSLTDKDKQDLEFGLSHGIDWISLSFVRKPEDIRSLKEILKAKGANVPVIAKIEKPQAIDHLEEILDECDGVMVARGDLGVEMSPEKVPMLQKQIIQACNRKSIPVITATQMLESMITNQRPTRAEASDVANAIIDGTDAVMLSGESAVGSYPVQAVEMMVRIAAEVERTLEFTNLPPNEINKTHVISEALNVIDQLLDLKYIAAFTTSGYTARLVAAERPRAPVLAFSCDPQVYRRLNLLWGVVPILLESCPNVMEELVQGMEDYLKAHNLASAEETILILGGSPIQQTRGTNFMKIHTIS